MPEHERPTLLSFDDFVGNPHPRSEPRGWRLLIAGLMVEASADTAKAYYLVLKTEVTCEQWDPVVKRALEMADKGGPAWFPKPGLLRQLAWDVKDEILSRRALVAGAPTEYPPVSDAEAAEVAAMLKRATGKDLASVVRPMPKAPGKLLKHRKALEVDLSETEADLKQAKADLAALLA